MTQGEDLLRDLSQDYKENIPEDLRASRSYSWYLDEAINNPLVLRSAHQRMADMFDYYGTEYDEENDILRYKMFSEDPLHDGEYRIMGTNVHQSIYNFVNKIKGGARRLGPDKRIKLLLGPVGSGKTQSDWVVRRYFEDYTTKDEGRMYTFRWVDLCDVIDDQDPQDDTVVSEIQQDPIVLLEQEERKEILSRANENLDRQYTLKNKQSLSRKSQYILDELLKHYDDDLEKVLQNHVEVFRLTANENQRMAIETFEPKDKKNQDETELTGEVDYSKIAVYGENDPRAFDYSGAFCNANRGIFSGEELLKLQREFLYDFLHATQEKTIKPKNNPTIDIDQVIVGRTNMPEYKDKMNDEKMEAFNDRTNRIDFPYILEYSKEAEVYEKLLENADAADCHVEPHTLEMAGLFAVLTRLTEPSKASVSLVDKAEVYNGKRISGINENELRDDADEETNLSEGLSGLSPRFVVDKISEVAMHRIESDENYLDALTLLNYFEEDISKYGGISDEEEETYKTHIEKVKEEYSERIIEDVRSALAYDDDELEDQAEKYVNNVMAYIDNSKVEDEITGMMEEPDEEFMRRVEEQRDIGEGEADDFRQEISNFISMSARKDEPYKPIDNNKLREAIKKKLWEDKKHSINFNALVTKGKSDEDRSQWIENLQEKGYSKQGALDVLEFAGAKIARERKEDQTE